MTVGHWEAKRIETAPLTPLFLGGFFVSSARGYQPHRGRRRTIAMIPFSTITPDVRVDVQRRRHHRGGHGREARADYDLIGALVWMRRPSAIRSN